MLEHWARLFRGMSPPDLDLPDIPAFPPPRREASPWRAQVKRTPPPLAAPAPASEAMGYDDGGYGATRPGPRVGSWRTTVGREPETLAGLLQQDPKTWAPWARDRNSMY